MKSNEILIGTATLDQSELNCNEIEGILPMALIFRTEDSTTDSVWSFQICDTPLSGQPRLIKFFKPILFLASDSSSGFSWSISYFFTATKKYNQEGGRRKTN